ncbi:gamma-glutamyl-gamma-aminobutyrate hydrolase family protein [Carboxylicivirga mesophila]|uniref:Gamma-glutamyl-gamma-aminobutyrate hydrolase family protein n=1 Tax=Carboxylicivirga mesophila TaxID=1166478 RepID=A0ABS5KE36_9BACT|nr:gamma-glutamyl-gamma-aminobutyrate hydrolase family protein [Carboxylicivirga mesophila]MBS2213184.1 gamma-glutamyl-gamma-aminobutyrate hydrolase family protein [Carboxylicivirga mesophila]
MKIQTLLLLLCSFNLSAQLLSPLPDHLNKRLLLAHPTTSTIEVISTLHQHQLIDLNSIELVGIYHKDETYDYSQSQLMLDTIHGINLQLYQLTDTLFADSLFCHNACSQTFQQLFDESEGIIFFGGPDIPASIYNELPHKRTAVTDPFRHYFEISFLYHLLGGYQNSDYNPLIEQNTNYLVFGICLGMQSMNVATGGTLIQDIPSEIFNGDETMGLEHLTSEEIHRNFYAKMPIHEGKQLAGSSFHQIVFKDYFFPSLASIEPESRPTINSYHHQAVETLGKGFVIGATSTDGKIIEGMFHAHYPNVFGVQFHPERSQFYLRSKKYTFHPEGQPKLLSDFLDEESMQFHIQFWQGINAILMEL